MKKPSLRYYEKYTEYWEALQNKFCENKVRIQHKHCRMAIVKAVKEFPRMRKIEFGLKVYTYETDTGICFTCKPKQKDCRAYRIGKVVFVRKQIGRNDWW